MHTRHTYLVPCLLGLLLMVGTPALAQSGEARTIEAEDILEHLDDTQADLMSMGLAREKALLVLENSGVGELRAEHEKKLDILIEYMAKARKAQKSLRRNEQVFAQAKKRFLEKKAKYIADCDQMSKGNLDPDAKAIASDTCSRNLANFKKELEAFDEAARTMEQKKTQVGQTLKKVKDIYLVLQKTRDLEESAAKFSAIRTHLVEEVDNIEIDDPDDIARMIAPDLFKETTPAQ